MINYIVPLEEHLFFTLMKASNLGITQKSNGLNYHLKTIQINTQNHLLPLIDGENVKIYRDLDTFGPPVSSPTSDELDRINWGNV